VFENCRFYYGGGSTYLSTLTFGGDSRATVKDSIFAHNGGGKFGCCYYGALDLSGALAGSVITGNIFYDNELPMSFDVLFSLDDSNTFHNPDDPSETNRLQGIFLNTTDDIYTPLTWAETEVAFVVNDNQLWINDPGSLTLGDNVVLKFTEGSAIVYSGTNLFNYDGTGVAFTSLKDDYLKGDTNGDGDTTGAGQNDWIGIYNDGNSYYETWPNIYYDSY
jgi:hypothetical protein